MSQLDTMGDRGPSIPRDIFEVLVRHAVDFVVIATLTQIERERRRT